MKNEASDPRPLPNAPPYARHTTIVATLASSTLLTWSFFRLSKGLHQPLRIGYVVSNAVAVPTIGTMCTNLENRTTITKMASYSCGSGKLVMKLCIYNAMASAG
jgi:hypothetical protein